MSLSTTRVCEEGGRRVLGGGIGAGTSDKCGGGSNLTCGCAVVTRSLVLPGKRLLYRGGQTARRGIGLFVFISDQEEEAALGEAGEADASTKTVPLDVALLPLPSLVLGVGLPQLRQGSSLVLPDAGADLLAGLMWHLPICLRVLEEWYLGYSTALDGVSLRTLYRRTSEVGRSLLVVEDSDGCIFGGFFAEALRAQSQGYYGTGECFAFRYPRAEGAWRAEFFPWRPSAGDSHFCFSTHSGIWMGAQEPALYVDQDLLRGCSLPSKTYGSPTLSTRTEFVIKNLETWHWNAEEARSGG